MQFSLISISRKVLDLPIVEWVTIPTDGGEITILANHEPLITALTPGVLTVKSEGQTTSYAIGGGFAEITPDATTVTADMVEDSSHMDLEAIRAKKEEALKFMETYKNSGESTDMETYIEMEQQFLKESAKEMLAMR